MRRGAERFFRYARERHGIYLRRAAGEPRPWTRDKILDTYRFTQVFRELDKTTRWFARHVREPLRDKPEVLLATVVFRMLNRIEVGEAVFCQTDMLDGKTAFERFLEDGLVKHLRRGILAHCGDGPYVTGAYIISSPPGYSKLDGVLEVIRRFAEKDAWHAAARQMRGGVGLSHGMSLEDAWEWLKTHDYFGKFHSYEIVTDLRHTTLLERASDVNEWCNVGPGARRGLCRVTGRELGERVPLEQMLAEMRDLLRMSRDGSYWPQDWPQWEMREVEHTTCEWDKYERVRLGEGRPRGVYR